jgi:TrpR-related protein YerC/YecD
MSSESDYGEDFHMLYEGFASLNTIDEFYYFMRDLMTIQEIKNFCERFKAARLLHDGGMTYREISEKTGISLVTVVRVAKFLNHENYGGYKLALNRVKRKIKN